MAIGDVAPTEDANAQEPSAIAKAAVALDSVIRCIP
jgi:hypothetical protein